MLEKESGDLRGDGEKSEVVSEGRSGRGVRGIVLVSGRDIVSSGVIGVSERKRRIGIE